MRIKSSKNCVLSNSSIVEEVIYLIPGNVYWKSSDGKFLGCNHNVVKSLGLKSPAEVIGKTNEDLFDIALAKKATATDKMVYNTGQNYTTEEPGLNIHGQPAIYYSKKKPLRDDSGKVIGLVGISIDITDRKNVEIELEKAKNKAEAASQAKSEFLANLSHDLRTPISSLVAINEYIVKQTQDQAINEIATDAHLCAEQLMYLIDEVLEITEIHGENIKNKIQTFQLRELLQSIVKLMMPAAKQKKLKLLIKYDECIPGFVAGRSHLIHRVLMNLVSNAIKFTHKGEVTIAVKLLEKKNKDAFFLGFNVSDTGIGIAQENHKRIFEKFERLTYSWEGNYQGRGLGLYIVKKFAELLNAELKFDSAENIGTIVQLIMPLKVAHQDQRSKEPFNFVEKKEPFTKIEKPAIRLEESSQQIEGNKKILLVEDAKIAQVVAKIALTPYIPHIDIANNGKEAIDLVKKNPFYDIIFLDIGLPDMSGLEVAKAIRAFEIKHNKRPTPIIALTAHLSLNHSHDALSAGIQQVMIKPITTQKADIVLKNWLQNTVAKQPISLAEDEDANKSIDLAKATTLFGNKELAKEFLNKFIKALPENARMIKQAFNNKDKKSLKDAIHYLKGSSAYAGVPLLERACNSLEAAINDEFSDEEISDLYNDVYNEIVKLLQEWKHI